LNERLINKNATNFRSEQGKFFGFPITTALEKLVEKITYKQIQLKTLLLFDPKKSPKKIQKILLHIVSKICKNLGGKSATWYRNFLTTIYNKTYNKKIYTNEFFITHT